MILYKLPFLDFAGTQPLRSLTCTLQTSDDSDGSEPILSVYKSWHGLVILDGHENLHLALLVFLFVIFVTQIGLTIAHVYYLEGLVYKGSYNSSLAFCLVFLLRLFTRCGLPLVLLIVTIDVTRKRANETVPVPQGDFRRKIQEERNESVLKEVVIHFWSEGLADETRIVILQKIRCHFEKALTTMHVASFCEAILLTVALWRLEAASYIPSLYQQMESPGPLVLRILDILTFFVLNFSSGVMFSFFFHEITVKHLVAAVVKVNDYSKVKLPKDLKRAAKATVDCIVSSWTILELFLYLGVQFYTIVLLISAAAQIPLSYGILGGMCHISWLIFVVTFTMLHILSTSPYYAPVIRGIGIILEVCGLCWLLCFDIPKFGGYLQILYVTVPGAYLFWYLVAMSYHEYIVLGQKPRDSRIKHYRRLGRNMAFLLQWTIVLIISITYEYLFLRSRATGSQPPVGSEMPLHVETFARTVQIGSHFVQETCVCYGNTTSSLCSCLSHRGP